MSLGMLPVWMYLVMLVRELGLQFLRLLGALEKCLKLDDELPDPERRDLQATILALEAAEPSALNISALRSASRYRTLPAINPARVARRQTLTGGLLLGLIFAITGPLVAVDGGR
jgi:hypothetical protein